MVVLVGCTTGMPMARSAHSARDTMLPAPAAEAGGTAEAGMAVEAGGAAELDAEALPDVGGTGPPESWSLTAGPMCAQCFAQCSAQCALNVNLQNNGLLNVARSAQRSAQRPLNVRST